MTLYPYQDLTITSKVQECCGREFAAKLGESDNNASYAPQAEARKFILISEYQNLINLATERVLNKAMSSNEYQKSILSYQQRFAGIQRCIYTCVCIVHRHILTHTYTLGKSPTKKIFTSMFGYVQNNFQEVFK